MNRRVLFRRLATIAAGAAAACALPAAESKADEDDLARLSEIAYHAEMGDAWCTQHPDPVTGAGHWHSMSGLLADARASAEHTRHARFETQPLSLSSMSDDCRERMCELTWSREPPSVQWRFHHTPSDPTSGCHGYVLGMIPWDVGLQRVDAWLRGLHG